MLHAGIYMTYNIAFSGYVKGRPTFLLAVNLHYLTSTAKGVQTVPAKDCQSRTSLVHSPLYMLYIYACEQIGKRFCAARLDPLAWRK